MDVVESLMEMVISKGESDEVEAFSHPAGFDESASILRLASRPR